MSKVSNNNYFLKFHKSILGGPIRAKEALIYSIIAEFEANKLPCFVSRSELAIRINESEATAERSLQTLIAYGLVKSRRSGRLRYLTTCAPEEVDLYQIDTPSVSK